MQKDSMISYQLPWDLSLAQFHGLVTDLYYRLRENGLDPSLNMVIGDHDEIFQVFVSEDAALILAQTCSNLTHGQTHLPLEASNDDHAQMGACV